MDTGTTFFTAQGRLFKEIMQRLPAVSCKSLTEQSHPEITYSLVNTAGEARDFTLSNKQYMLRSSEGGRFRSEEGSLGSRGAKIWVDIVSKRLERDRNVRRERSMHAGLHVDPSARSPRPWHGARGGS